jgi:hypothetical protein
LIENDTDGDIFIIAREILVPESLTFEVQAAGCYGVDTIEFALNDVRLGTLNTDQFLSCWCMPLLETHRVDDSHLLQTLWNPAGGNSFEITKHGSGAAVATIRARLASAGFEDTVCLFDIYGGDCSSVNMCSLGASFDPIFVEVEVSDPFVREELISERPFVNSELPESIDLHGLPDGLAEVCLEAAGLPTLYGSSSGGELFSLDLHTGAGRVVGTLPTSATEIEYDEISGRAFLLAEAFQDWSYRQEFDIGDGSAVGPRALTYALFTALEYVGVTLYGTFNADEGPALGTLHPFTGGSTLIGSTGTAPVAGLAYDERSGLMYGIAGASGTADLLTIDLEDGQATLVGSTGIPAESLEFGPDGRLYAGTGGVDGGLLYRIDPMTGASTLVGPTGFDSVAALTLVESLFYLDCAGFTRQGEPGMTINGGPCYADPIDSDGDALADYLDNCPFAFNPEQTDSGGTGAGNLPDGIGDACQCGDVDADGIVTIADIVLLERHLVGLPPGLASPEKCNVIGEPGGGDATCRINDLTIIRRAIAGLGSEARQICGPAWFIR